MTKPVFLTKTFDDKIDGTTYRDKKIFTLTFYNRGFVPDHAMIVDTLSDQFEGLQYIIPDESNSELKNIFGLYQVLANRIK